MVQLSWRKRGGNVEGHFAKCLKTLAEVKVAETFFGTSGVSACVMKSMTYGGSKADGSSYIYYIYIPAFGGGGDLLWVT